jgi:hypothetical protein
VEELHDATSAADTVDIYACYETQQAERLVEILEEEGLDVLVRDRSSTLFPTNVGKSAQHIIAVAGSSADRAREVITSAVRDGVVPDDGEMLKA